ncbi:MAG TPA: DUF805 domain-containing protein [Allosphingosinicella sp.]|jgi:uncharacterized membrane protein YhaH (DUF805 family)
MSARIGLWEHFRKLATFSGREDRASFWPYAALALGVVMVAGSLMTLPMMAWLIQSTPQFGAPDPGDLNVFAEDGDFSTPAAGQPAEPSLPLGFLAAYLAVTLGLAVLLYAAAVCRRLHDRGRSGAWGLMPLPFFIYVSVQSVRLVDSLSRAEEPDLTLFLTIAASNVVGWAALLALVVLLAAAGDPGPNRFDVPD